MAVSQASLQVLPRATDDLEIYGVADDSSTINTHAVSLSNLTPTSSPPVSTAYVGEITLDGGGAGALDFSSLPQVRGPNVDVSGKKLQYMLAIAPATNAAAIEIDDSSGVSNNYVLTTDPGVKMSVPPGGHAGIYKPETLADVAAGDLAIEFNGTAGDVLQLELWFG